MADMIAGLLEFLKKRTNAGMQAEVSSRQVNDFPTPIAASMPFARPHEELALWLNQQGFAFEYLSTRDVYRVWKKEKCAECAAQAKWVVTAGPKRVGEFFCEECLPGNLANEWFQGADEPLPRFFNLLRAKAVA